MKKCNHKDAWRDGCCCCNCQNHIKDMSHPYTDGKAPNEQRGWICLIPKMSNNPKPIAFSGWSEHGFCELHDPKEGE